MALGTPANEVQGTLSASFTRGTDTNIVLNSGEGANFPNSPQVVRLTDGDHWCLLKYSSVSTDTLVMASATDYALENNVSSGDETYTWPVGSAVELIMTADYLKELQDGTLHLDQTTPQTVINGVPLMEETPIGAADIKSLVNKEYVDLAVTSLGASYYMYDEDDATGYKTCYLDPSTDAETYLEKASLSDGDYIGGWISADGIAPAKLLKGVYNWYVMLEKTAGTQSLRVYWQLIERKSDNSETVIATSSDSNEISSKESYLVPLQLNSDYIPDPGSRIVGKLYAAVSGGGNAPTVRVYYQDATSSRWEIPASSEIFKNIFVPYSGATQNIDLGGRDISDLGKLNFDAATELTISSGAITITQTLHTVDTEGDASTDNLDTINGGTAGDVLYLRAADGSRTVVLKHGTGNIVTPDGNDYSLDDANKVVQLTYGSDSKWHLIGSVSAQIFVTNAQTITLGTDIPDSLSAIPDWLSGKSINAEVTFQLTSKTYSEQLDLLNVSMGTGGRIIIKGNGTTNTVIDGGSTRDYCVQIAGCVVTLRDLAVKGSKKANILVDAFADVTLAGNLLSDTCDGKGIEAARQAILRIDPDCNLEVKNAGVDSGISLSSGSFLVCSSVDTGSVKIHDCTYEGLTIHGLSNITLKGDSSDTSKIQIYSNGRDGVRFDTSSSGYMRYLEVGGNTGYGFWVFQRAFLNLFNASEGTLGDNGNTPDVYASDGGFIRYSSLTNLDTGADSGKGSYTVSA